MFRSTISSFVFTLSILIVSIFAGSATAAPSDCEVLLPDDVQRRAHGFDGETHCYRLELSSPGFLHLDLVAPSTSASRPRLALTAVDDSPALTTIWRSAAEQLQRVAAGSYVLEVSAEDPRQPLPAYRLSSRSVAMEKSETDGELEVDPVPLTWDPRKSETDGELEVDPVPLTGCLQKSETDGELEVDPVPLQVLCKGGDDHGDTFACATPIQRSGLGELDNGWGDDVDVFRFQVDRWQTLEIVGIGPAGLRGELYDANGQHLTGLDRADRFRLVRTLGSGTYFVRLDGYTSGAYHLEIRYLD